MTQFVVGFMFSKDLKRVVLIRKTHPRDQQGFLNGLGGCVHADEMPAAAMEREFEEEAGIFHPREEWHRFTTRNTAECTVYVYYTVSARTELVRARTEEAVEVVEVQDLLFNLDYFQPLVDVPALIAEALSLARSE